MEVSQYYIVMSVLVIWFPITLEVSEGQQLHYICSNYYRFNGAPSIVFRLQ